MPAATGNFLLDKGYDAAAAITKFRAVKFSAAETVTPVTAATDVPCGVAQVGVTAGELALGKGVNVRTAGITEMEGAEAMATPGIVVCINASGQAISYASASATHRIIGTLEQPCGGAGQRCSVRLNLSGAVK
jgi:hypothetical protein